MRPSPLSLAALALALTLAGGEIRAQEPEPTPTPAATPPGKPPPAAPASLPPPPTAAPAPVATPAPAPATRVSDPAVVSILQAPAENPFGLVPQIAAALPPKLTFTDAVVSGAAFVSARVDLSGKPLGLKQERDPIPSLSGDARKSLARWVFDPARQGGQSVESWAAMRLELQVEIDAPRSVQGTLNSVTPATPLPKPMRWPSDEEWLESRGPIAPDGTVPIDKVDTPPMPRKTPWTADSYRGPFHAKFWVRVKSSGVVEKAIPFEASDPILLGYLRRAMSMWTFRPAQSNGVAADSWNELVLSGQVAYTVDLKQIASLRRPLSGS